MNKLKELLYILITITLGIIAIKFVIWLLPIILVALCIYYIYKSVKKNKKQTNKPKTKTKNIKIIDMVEDNN